MGDFQRCYAVTAAWEGGWSDHPADPGGKTNWGITQATLSAYRGRPVSADEVRSLTKPEAQNIYRKEYWDRIAGDALPAGVALCIFDFGVNSGPARAVKSLQAVLGVPVDGWVGEKTLAAIEKVDQEELVRDLCSRRLAFLRHLPTFSTFGKGWTNRVNDIQRRALAMSKNDAAADVAVAPDVTPIPSTPSMTAKALPPAPKEQSVSPDQKIGAGSLAVIAVLGPIAAFYRDNKDVLSDPRFLGVAAILSVIIITLLLRKPKPVEVQ